VIPPTPSETAQSSWSRAARAVASAPIVAYQRFVSPAIPRRCKYEPTCSRYAVSAIRRYGILRGLVLAGWRLLRCNPWSHGGYDPVEAQRVFSVGPKTEH
jgi:putative membrane protein insertion efficiency factor